MSRQLADLEQTLAYLVAEHRKLLEQIEAQQLAMRELKPELIENITNRQETTRMRIATLDVRRRTLTQQIGKLVRIPGNEPTITQLAQAFPQRAQKLYGMRNELRDLATAIQARNTIASRLASAVLGHLNTAVRVIAGAVEQAGVYTKNGTPRVSARIGAIEAVG
jgi:flagellar biosynthesis/type III secretory pathway chaperone